MEIINVLAAALASWLFGAVWYTMMAGPWMAAAGLSEDKIDRKNPVPYVVSFVAAVVVAGMMRHVIAVSGLSGIASVGMIGLGLGIFIVTPWIVTNYLFAQRPMMLTIIDGVYATAGCTIMAIVLVLF